MSKARDVARWKLFQEALLNQQQILSISASTLLCYYILTFHSSCCVSLLASCNFYLHMPQLNCSCYFDQTNFYICNLFTSIRSLSNLVSFKKKKKSQFSAVHFVSFHFVHVCQNVTLLTITKSYLWLNSVICIHPPEVHVARFQ